MKRRVSCKFQIEIQEGENAAILETIEDERGELLTGVIDDAL